MTIRRDESPLLVNVAGLLGESPGSHRDLSFDVAVLDLGPDLVQASPAAVRVHLARTNRGLLVTGSVSTTLSDTCSRCLAPARVAVSEEIDEEVLPSLDLATGVALDTMGEPEALRLSDHHELDLETLVREAIQLAEPIAPLCRADCAGLCPECGADRNAGPHDHGPAAIDPRLDALRAFRPDEDG